MKSCRTCLHAYLRVPKTWHYIYEACAFGVIPMQPNLPDDCGCEWWGQRETGAMPKKESVVIWGQDIQMEGVLHDETLGTQADN